MGCGASSGGSAGGGGVATEQRPADRRTRHRQAIACLSGLHEAAREGDVERLRQLHKASVDLAARDAESGSTALHFAARNGHSQIVEALLGWETEIDAKNNLGNTPLHLSASYGRRECARLLVGAGADLEARNAEGTSVVEFARARGDPEIIALLDPYLAAAKERAEAQAAKDASLVKAVTSGDSAAVARLLAEGARPDKQENGVSALGWATLKGHARVIEQLQQAGADVNCRNKWGDTALITAADNGHADCVAALLQLGVAIEATNQYGLTALISAACYGNVECARLLLEAGADPEHKAHDGKTA